MYDNLNGIQIQGVNYGLSEDQVKAKTFTMDTLCAMEILKERYPSMSYPEIFLKVKELNSIQVNGLKYGLTENQVQSKNFGNHTIFAMKILKQKNKSQNYQEIFSILEGLDEAQAIGVSEYNLAKKDVEHESYGKHTYIGMRDLVKQGFAPNYEEAFLMVKGFNKFQVGKVTVDGYSREKVEQLDTRAESFTQAHNSELRHPYSMNSFEHRKEDNNNPKKLGKGMSV